LQAELLGDRLDPTFQTWPHTWPCTSDAQDGKLGRRRWSTDSIYSTSLGRMASSNPPFVTLKCAATIVTHYAAKRSRNRTML